MKSKIVESNIEEVKPAFPCTRENIITPGLIVLFTGLSSGTVINEGDQNADRSDCKRYPLGMHCESWVSCEDKKYWKDWKGTITYY